MQGLPQHGSVSPSPPLDKGKRVHRDRLRSRLQMKVLPIRTPTWLKLYEVLVELEHEINATLPSFQELVVLLSNPSAASQSAHPPSANHAKTLRKRLLTDLASYDTVSKRIRDLPLPPDAVPGGSQDRLQRALANRGAAFLSEKLGLLRSLGNVEELGGGGGGKGKGKKKDGKGEGEYTVKSLASLLEKEGVEKVNEKVGPELEAMAKLNVLRECVPYFLPLDLLGEADAARGRSDKKRSSSRMSTTPTPADSSKTPRLSKRVSRSCAPRSRLLARRCRRRRVSRPVSVGKE